MWATKPEVETGSGNKTDFDAIRTANPTFSATPDSDMPLTTRSDVGRHREPAPETQMSTTETGSGNNFGTESDGDAI